MVFDAGRIKEHPVIPISTNSISLVIYSEVSNINASMVRLTLYIVSNLLALVSLEFNTLVELAAITAVLYDLYISLLLH